MLSEPDSTNYVVKNVQGDGNGQRAVEYVDVDLVRRAKGGDKAAFEELFNRYYRRVYNIVYQMASDENEAADLTQEVFVRVYRSLPSLKVEEAFFTWLRTMAVNICRDHARRKKPVRVESLDEKLTVGDGEIEKQVADWKANPERSYQSKDLQRAVQKAVSSLSEDHKIVVVLHHLQGMDVKDIAKAVGSPVGTVKSRLARARDELRRKLSGYVEPD